MVMQVRYPVKSDAIREIQEEVVKSKMSWKRVEMLKPIFISVKYYDFVKGVKAGKKTLK